MKTIINQDGKVPLFNRDGVKTTIQVVQKEVKQIEVIVTEPVSILDIDLTPLNLIEGSIFNVLSYANFVDTGGNPVNGRNIIRINNITTIDYYYATAINNAFFLEGSIDSLFNTNSLNNMTLINGNLSGQYTSLRIDSGLTRRAAAGGCQLLNNNIQQVTTIRFMTSSTSIFNAPGNRFVITKLN
jgi:hypothetical protein